MIHEFAVDPTLVVEWARDENLAGHFIGEFGIGKPKVVSMFPENWGEEVSKVYGKPSGFLSDSILGEVLAQIKSGMAVRRSTRWNGRLDWVRNAVKEDGFRPFRAILAKNNPTASSRVIAWTNVLSLQKSNLWNVEHGKVVARNEAEITRALEPMLRASNEFYFIDPHFNPSWGTKRRPLIGCIQELAKGRMNSPPKTIEYFFLRPEKPPNIAKECQRLNREIPRGFNVVFQMLKQTEKGKNAPRLHNRYIFTDIGGVLFGHGLDEGRRGEKDVITLLSLSQYTDQRSDYIGPNSVFERDDEPISVVGTGKCGGTTK